ncbi:MAG: type III pantothenate kinase [Bacteroidales bacterium]|nr:type III pantothenate kinase [Bacteroidales bacterium]MBN2750880.1 type III pantothenate kinase [Bacteroidales bacterium]
MNLIIDIGNTLTKVSVVNGQQVLFFSRYERLQPSDVENVVAQFKPQKAIYSAVGAIPTEAIGMMKQLIPYTLELTHNTPIPLINCYESKVTLGLDRLAVAVGASWLYPNTNLLVIDSGTAITYELVTSKGEYLGGAISPGINMRFAALNHFTQRLPKVSVTSTFPLVGTNTQSCIQSGVLNGIVNEVIGYILESERKFPNLETVLTGGDANFFETKLKNNIFVIPNLLTLGLNRILEFNAKENLA